MNIFNHYCQNIKTNIYTRGFLTFSYLKDGPTLTTNTDFIFLFISNLTIMNTDTFWRNTYIASSWICPIFGKGVHYEKLLHRDQFKKQTMQILLAYLIIA